VVVDPQRDPQPYLEEADRLGVAVAAVLETHIHNDYVTGGLALARASGASYAIPAGEPVSFLSEARPLEDGEGFSVGRLEVTAIATAGHTDHHLAYAVKLSQEGRQGAADEVVCTGGSLLLNATGRTDLLGQAMAEDLARAQWRSVRRLLEMLPPETGILPTHGFGSFCSATPNGGEGAGVATIAQERERNPAAVLGEDEFVVSVLKDPPPIPAYYRHMAPLNRKGPLEPVFETVPFLDARAVARAVAGPGSVVDLRQRSAFAAAHLPGVLNLELGTNLTTYLGWIIPWESDLVFLADDADAIEEARRLVARIGRDELFGAGLWGGIAPALGEPARASYPVARFSDLAGRWREAGKGGLHVLDVRHRHEWEAGHIDGAHLVPLPELASREPGGLAASGQVWVHCGAGFRAAAAASLLSGWGAAPVLIDDTWDHALISGLPIV
jgi:glyoxylase-like metal-dependent hydrolase (beta-lactamase superfamily II)/rhodanese-related sulfurtransferase